MRVWLGVALALAVACGDDDGTTDAGADSGGSDSGMLDATTDVGGDDAGDPDAGDPDAGDAGCPDDDGDGVCNDDDQCINGDDALDADSDGVADACDQCNGSDDSMDDDGDMVPDGCDCDTSADMCDANATCAEAMTGIECTCNDGYTGDGATCDPVDCGALDPPDDGSVDAAVTTFESVATYSCDTGFTLAGEPTRMCQADGTWSGDAPICSSIDCGALTAPADGMVDVPSTGFSSVATYSCDDGYVLTGDMTRTCQNDSMWSGAEPTCTFVDCGSLPPLPEGMVTTDRTSFGGTATYTCNAGFTLMGTDTRTCRAGGSWSGRAPTCAPVDCGALPPPANGDVVAPTTTFGSIASYFCDSGFMMSGGNAMRTCQSDGGWDGTPPMCVPEIIDCGAPPAPTNGSVSAPDTTAGNFATYSCDAGYRLFTSHRAICQADRTWLGSPPVCAEILTCGCGGHAEGERVEALINTPGGASGVTMGQRGTVVAGLSSSNWDLIDFDGWGGGHDGNCGAAGCGVCTPDPGGGRWYMSCPGNIQSLRLTCTCSGQWTPGDRVVALVDGPSGAVGLPAGRQGTVISATGFGPLIEWDAWTDGHNGNCGATTCGVCTASGTNNRWYTECQFLGRP